MQYAYKDWHFYFSFKYKIISFMLECALILSQVSIIY